MRSIEYFCSSILIAYFVWEHFVWSNWELKAR